MNAIMSLDKSLKSLANHRDSINEEYAYIKTKIEIIYLSSVFASLFVALSEFIMSRYHITNTIASTINGALSSYSGLVLVASRFYFKYDSKKETLAKMGASCAFLVDRIQHKHSLVKMKFPHVDMHFDEFDHVVENSINDMKRLFPKKNLEKNNIIINAATTEEIPSQTGNAEV